MALLRFIVSRVDPDSESPKGLLSAAYDLAREGVQDPHQQEGLSSLVRWFEANLNTPDRFNTSTSKGYYRRKAKGLSWLKDSATECLEKMHRLKAIAEENGIAVHVIHETRVGYIAYEDDLQVVAEPFASTKVSV